MADDDEDDTPSGSDNSPSAGPSPVSSSGSFPNTPNIDATGASVLNAGLAFDALGFKTTQ